MDDLSTRRTEDRLRAGLHARAALLDPPDRLDDVLEAAGSARRRRWVPLAAAAAVAAVAGGAVWAGQGDDPERPRPTSVAQTPSPTTAPPTVGPSPTPSPTTSSSPSATASPAAALPVYAVAPEVLLAPDGRYGLRRTWLPTTATAPEDRVRVAVDATLDRPVDGVDADPWAGVDVRDVTVADDAVTVTLTGPPRPVAEAVDDLVLPAIGWTAQAVLGRGNVPVTVRTEDATLATLTRPAADESYAVLADVWLTTPLTGAVLPADRAVVAAGEASVFEANLLWRLERDGDEVDAGNVMTTAGAPARGRYEIDLGRLPAGRYTLTVVAPSPKDGSDAGDDVAQFEVR